MVRLAIILVAAISLVGLFLLLRPRPAPPEARAFDVSILGGRMIPSDLAVRAGDELTLRIYSDRPGLFHVHGYDVTQALTDGGLRTLSFTANLVGRFEIDDELQRQDLGTLIVRPR